MEADINKAEIINKLMEAQKAGKPYDSVIIKTARNDEWFGINVIVFDNTQIKSATGNSGAFSRTNPNIDADTGGYARRAPSGEADMGGYADRPLAMQLPEIVDLAQQLLDGKLPRIMKALRGMAIGRFRHGTGEGSKGSIELQANIFKDLNEATKVLAHEIGHLIDWLPDKIMTRGNILGHVASLRDYMKHWLAEKPGAPGPLTEKEKKP
jgi:hypothetical protein